MAVKERILTGIMQSRRWRENAGSVAFPKARQTIYSFVSVLTSRIAGYVIRKSGGVGGALSDGRPDGQSPRMFSINIFHDLVEVDANTEEIRIKRNISVERTD